MKKILLLLPALILFTSMEALANKTSVEVKVPSECKKGTDITVVINVMHKGNSKMHHTDWVTLKVNGQEIKKWEYGKENLPPDGDFKLEYKLNVTDDTKVEAQGHCSIHGSAGPQTASIKAN